MKSHLAVQRGKAASFQRSAFSGQLNQINEPQRKAA
jgi:hypothetical protein